VGRQLEPVFNDEARALVEENFTVDEAAWMLREKSATLRGLAEGVYRRILAAVR
jgi:hypothetical protein